MKRRRYLGRNFSRYERIYVYLIENGLEVDVSEGYDIQRVRVFFEDIRLVTMHIKQARIAAIISGVLILMVLIGSLILWLRRSVDEAPVYMVLSLVIWLTLIPVLLYFISSVRPRLTICVYGHRSKATMQWHWQHQAGRAVFAELTAAITANQAEKRTRLAREEAQAPSAFGPPPDALQAMAGTAAAAPSVPAPDASSASPAASDRAAADAPPAFGDDPSR